MEKSGRSLGSRNFFGAALGGILGILAFGYINYMLLPVGVFLGVVLGFWYDQIGVAYVQGLARAKRWKGTVEQRCLTMACFVRSMPSVTERAKRRMLIADVFVGGCTVLLFLWLSLKGVTLLAEIQDRFRSVSELLTIGAVLVGIVGLVATVLTTSFSIVVRRDLAKEQSWLVAERFTKSPRLFLLREIMTAMYLQAVFLSLLILSTFFWVGIGGAFVAFVIVPLYALGLTLRPTVGIIRSGGHWLCFFVTLMVTSIFAYGFRNSIAEPLILWSVAFATGLSSAVCVEFVRRTLAVRLDSSRLSRLTGRNQLDLTEEWVMHAKDRFMDLWRRIGEMIEKLPLMAPST